VIGRLVATLKGFLLWLLESGKCNNSRFPIRPITSPATIGNREEQCIESLRKTKKGGKLYSGWFRKKGMILGI
jgi:hypothetical protein